MQIGILHCSPETPLCDAAQQMAQRHCSSILVVKDGQPVGIWTEHDALSIDFSDGRSVKEPISYRMSYPVASIDASLPMGEATFTRSARRP